MITDIPVLPGFEDERHIIVWCFHCGAYHAHGGGGEGEAADGHRCAHCTEPDSPYDVSGYYVVNVGPAPEWVVRDSHRQRPRGPGTLGQQRMGDHQAEGY